MTVMIGVDPHKGSHTAVAVDAGERSLAELRVRSGPKQLDRLLRWAERFWERTWAVENATGLGYLLAQQLVAAGQRVLDVQPKLAARVRLLDTESTNKNDPHDALSVAIAALRSPAPKEVGVEDHAAVMKIWARRHPQPVEHPHSDRLPPARGAVRPGRWRRPWRDLRRQSGALGRPGRARQRRGRRPGRARRGAPR